MIRELEAEGQSPHLSALWSIRAALRSTPEARVHREVLEQIASMPTVQRNPDGDDQAAATMKLLAREALDWPASASTPEAGGSKPVCRCRAIDTPYGPAPDEQTPGCPAHAPDPTPPEVLERLRWLRGFLPVSDRQEKEASDVLTRVLDTLEPAPPEGEPE